MLKYDPERAKYEGQKFREIRMDEGWMVYYRRLLERMRDLTTLLVSESKKSPISQHKIAKIGGQIAELKNVLGIPKQIQKDLEKAEKEGGE